MKIAVIFGTRPEAIKLAPVILALKRESDVECKICVTAQHRQLLDQVLGVFGITPDTDLNLMVPNQSLAGLSARAIEAVDAYLARERPGLVLVQGDTTTVFCAGLAAFYRRVLVGHVEAGLRTWNMNSPWPEEANRVLCTRLAALHFAPTESARQNLLREGVCNDSITVTGNTVIDALFLALRKVRDYPLVVRGLPSFLQPSKDSGNVQPRIVLITGHRRESFGHGFENICHAIHELAQRFPETHFVYPVHMNPRVREPVARLLASRGPDQGPVPNIHLLPPLSYIEFVTMMERASVILTDSGGVQEEAPSLGKPVLVMRETTERPEGLHAGTVRLVGTAQKKIVDEVTRLLTQREAYEAMANAHNPYGDGCAAGRIVEVCRGLSRTSGGSMRGPTFQPSALAFNRAEAFENSCNLSENPDHQSTLPAGR
jgi:UDP-N-acetylglucosamine 2-epimerase (non-hydrolysing)